MRHRGGTLFDLAHAFERLVALQPAQFGKSVDLRRVIQHVAAECRDQARPVDEWCQRQEDEAAFRTVAAPVARTPLRRLTERGIAAAEHRQVVRMACEAARNGNLRQRPQQGEILSPSTTCRSSNWLSACSKLERLAVLMVHVGDVGRARRMLVRHRDRIEPTDDRAGEHDHAEDAGDRHMTIQRTGRVQLEQHRIERRVTWIAGCPDCAIVASIGAA